MKRVSLCLLGVLTTLVTITDAQYGFMDGFMSGFSQGMNNFMRGMSQFQTNLQSNLENMGQRIQEANQRRAAMLEPYTRNLRPGEGRQIDDGNIRGYVYKNYDGSISYSVSTGSPGSSGYVFHSGPGGTFERRW